MSKKIVITFFSLLGLGSFCINYFFNLRYTFNSEGRYFDPMENVVYQDTSDIWWALTVIFLIPIFIYLVLNLES